MEGRRKRRQRTMENTKERLERPGQPEPPVDYFLVVAHYADWFVSREMAQAIEASLNQTPAPQWVIFVDLTGARVRVRTRHRVASSSSEGKIPCGRSKRMTTNTPA